MTQESDILWSGRPWIGPGLVVRTLAVVAVAILATVALSALGVFAVPVLSTPLYVWVFGLLGLVWLGLLLQLLVLRASWKYLLRRSSLEVEAGIVRKEFLLVSPAGFSQLEVDQGVVGRLLNYGTLAVKAQGGQQVTLQLIRDPRGVAAKLREVMTVPTVRIAPDQPTLMARPAAAPA